MRTICKTTLVSTLLAVGAMVAQARPWQSGPVTVEVLGQRSAPFEQFPTSGSGGDVYRAYLKAQRGAPYRIRVRNRSDERIGVVIAVDGRNILSGERSDLQRHEAMYVLEPWGEGEYAGWRSNLSSINQFYFSDWRDSYAEAFGDRSARGVIAVAAFPELVQYQREPQYDEERGGYGERGKGAADSANQSGARSSPAPSASAESGAARSKSRDSEPGTGYGERRWDPARRVQFEAQSEPLARVFLKYEWPETLCARGISCGRGRSEHNRFWHEDTYGFAPPPPFR